MAERLGADKAKSMKGRFQFSTRAVLAATAAVAGALALWRIAPNPYSLTLVLLIAGATPVVIALVMRRARGNAKVFCQVAILPAIVTFGVGISVIGAQVFGIEMDYPRIQILEERWYYTNPCQGPDRLAMAQDNLLCWLRVSILAGTIGVLIRHSDTDAEPNAVDETQR